MGAYVRYQVLGPLEVRDDDLRVVVPARRKQRVLLALLLFRPNVVVRTGLLLDELWGDERPVSAAANLQSYVASLRQLVGRERLQTHRGGYLLRVDPEELDAQVFSGLAETGSRQLRAGAAAAAVENLTAALDLWRGPVLDGLPAPDSLRAATTRLEDLRVSAVEDRLEAKLQLGRHTEAAMELRAMATDHPLRERVWSLLMLALYRWGRQDEALDAYQQIRRRLADELGVEPGSQVRQMHQRILNADPALDHASDSILRPRQLPPDVTTLVGREGKLAAIDAEAAGSAHMAIIAMVGPAGAGKTALAVRWAHHAAARFPDGQLFVDLRGHSSLPALPPMHVLTRFLLALGVRPGDIPSDLADAAAMFRSALAGKRMLVVLDNAAGSEQVRPLLPGSAGNAVLVTSRDRLAGLAATHDTTHVMVCVLRPTGSVELLRQTLGARRVAAEPDAAMELALMCAGLPLALRIAAANLDTQPNRRIADYLKAMTGGNVLAELAVPGDHQAAVRTAFDLSYAALPDEAARLFKLLGLLPGTTFGTLAAAALTGGDQATSRRAIEELVTAHLIDHTEDDSFTTHNLLRRYAMDKAEQEIPAAGREAARIRLFEYYLRSATNAISQLFTGMVQMPLPAGGPDVVATTFASRDEATEWLSAQYSNLLAAVHFTAQHGPIPYACRLTDMLRGFFSLKRSDAEWRDAAEVSLTAARSVADIHAIGAMRHSLGSLAWMRGEARRAIEELTAARAAYREAGEAKAAQMLAVLLGAVHLDMGLLDDAANLFQQALQGLVEQGRTDESAQELAKLGIVHLQSGRLAEAVHYSMEAIQAGELIQCLDSVAASRCTLGECALATGELEVAREHVHRALELWQELHYVDDQAYAFVQLSKVERAAGRGDEANRYARLAMDAAIQVDSTKYKAAAHNALGEHAEALALSRQVEYRRGEIEALLGLAAANPADRQYATEAHELATTYGFRPLAGQAGSI